MIHGQDSHVTPLHTWQNPHKGYIKVVRSFKDRGYDTIHALKTFYDRTRWVIVHEIQNHDTVMLLSLLSRGRQRRRVRADENGSVRLVSTRRMDLTLHAIPNTGLWFWSSIEAAGFSFPDQTLLESMRREFE